MQKAIRSGGLCLALLLSPTAVLSEDAPVPRPLTPIFQEEQAAESGVDTVYNGDWEFMVGGGVSTFDCDDDRFPDMLLPGGSGKSVFYHNESKKGGAIRFKAKTSGLEIDKLLGSYAIDIDGDGIKDIILLRLGENIVMRGKGKCQFERANETWNFDGGKAWSAAMAATWERGNTWPTIAIGNYIDPEADMEPWGSCTDNWLHRPETATPQRKFANPLPLTPSYCALSMLFTDWNRSGTPSLRVSNDREYYKGGREQMWHVDPGKAPVLYSEEEGWKYLRIWGMGIASYDLDFDGYPEYFLTSMADNKLQTLQTIPKDGKAPAAYKDIAFAKGVTAHRPYTGGDWHPSTAWHTDFQDVNNDGLVDLFIAKGNVAEMPDFAKLDPNNLLVQNARGNFVEMGLEAGVASMNVSRGAALVDFNLDGLVDLVVTNRWKPAQVWRNVTPDAGHFIEIGLKGDGGNRDGIGAWIEVKHDEHILRREVTIGGGHAGGSLGWHHFGVGKDTDVAFRVIWPNGEADDWQKVPANGFYWVSPKKAAAKWE
ncbi:CRTAC1 family protein [Rhizobium sp. C4]|uniref:CRTAC1 family protein n=1 Tax=Rhizobium sp. C4 TaxID=1349800 RepID=UPI001E3D561F|nr:CRTAC1 family protein [Rhizobium sp. C4]MCD2174463.1 CRTAC1 family protein [Rhizobium sp. C4]